MHSKRNKQLIEEVTRGWYRYHPYTNYSLLVAPKNKKRTIWMVKPEKVSIDRYKDLKTYHPPLDPIYFDTDDKAIRFALKFKSIADVKFEHRNKYYHPNKND
ncbi:hypothetical protein OAI36_00435 [Alphaproteobacteria bacterium]|jgi:hypothetical protein|nr:hypothetical protein [Alphaproteobacteria bacterium]|tara:strand:+ start:266 stop:571 length:306 start_codon:yes stop_codon:yes gene_type:complete